MDVSKNTVIITWCECCYTSRVWPREMEKWLMAISYYRCDFCYQTSEIPKDLKKMLRKRWGMFQ